MLCFFGGRGEANVILNPYTGKPISTDSILGHVMTYAPLYETIVDEFRADLYIKGKVNVRKKNFIIRYVPSMFRLQKGVREYLLETNSDLHFTAPNIYDQKVKASMGTIKGVNRGVPGLLEYFSVNIYSSSLLNDERLMSPLSKYAEKYYTFLLDTVMGTPDNLDYKIRFIPKSKSDQLVGGYLIVSSNVWSVREIRFSGRSGLMTFMCLIEMGKVGEMNEFLPVRYDMEAQFNFLGNKMDGSYTVLLNYRSINFKEGRARKKDKKFNLSDSFSLKCDTNACHTDPETFAVLRPIPLTEKDKLVYHNYNLRKDTLKKSKESKSVAFWGAVGDLFLEDYKFNLSKFGSVRCSPFINPLLLSYGSSGLSYRQDFRYQRLFIDDRLLRMTPKIGYNFTHKEFYWSINGDFEYWPQKRGGIHLSVGNGNRIYSSDVLENIQSTPDSIFNMNSMRLDYFRDLFFNFRHSFEPINGLDISLGVAMHCRTLVNPIRFEYLGSLPSVPPPNFLSKIKNSYTSFAPRVRIEWTPCLYYYMNGKRKINYGSKYPTISVDYERGIEGVFKSTGQYERIEVDAQHRIRLGAMRSLYYRIGGGMFTNQKELFFVDFANFSKRHLPVGWNDEIGGVFQLLDGRWYNSSKRYLRAHLTYEAPFLLMPHLVKYTRYVENERLYLNVLSMPHLRPYVELGYGIGTHVFDFGFFIGSEEWKSPQIGCKFTFELFNR